MNNSRPWHSLPLAEIYKLLRTSESGLSSAEAAKRLKKFGPNSLPTQPGITSWQILLSQIKSPLIYILILAIVVSFSLGEIVDGLVILVIVIINSAIGFIQENKANQALDKLKKIIHYEAKVWRQGQPTVVTTDSLTLGDVVVLEAGMKVPADCRLVTVNELKVVEATLTGEAEPIIKQLRVLPTGSVLADRKNMVHLGTTVVSGKGLGVVCAVGKNTELGKIAALIEETVEDDTPLQKKIGKLSQLLAISVVVITILLFVVGVLSGRDLVEMFLVSVAVAVAAIPEGLAVALTVILVIGMQKIFSKGSLVRRLIAAETLGGTTVICSDKTGTLTEGKMRVVSILTSEEHFQLGGESRQTIFSDISLALEIGMLCNDSFVLEQADQLQPAKFIGDPMEQALLVAGAAVDLDQEKLNLGFPRVNEIPFTSERMYMATLNKNFMGPASLLVKGAPEILLQSSNFLSVGKKIVALKPDKAEQLLKKFDQLTGRGLRLLAVAYKKLDMKNKNFMPEVSSLIFVGVIVFKDPLRADAKETVRLCQQAGIKPVIITGDHKLTAINIANEVGIKVDKNNVLVGSELDKMDDKTFGRLVSRIKVYARVEPRHKIRIVDELQRQGEVVAMTGDGVNDAPALKAADIGIALGSGTDVAKETADLVLLDDSFRTIVEAVRGGRVIFDNIKKVILYLLFSSFSEVILIGGAILAGLPLPLLATQILWVNVIQDSIPIFAMSADPEEPGIMSEPPRGLKIMLFDRMMKFLIFFVGSLVNLLILVLIFYFYKTGHSLEYIQTFSFVAIAIGSIFYIFACRSLRLPLWQYNPLGNNYINGAVAFGVIAMVSAVYLPWLQNILHTIPLAFNDWLILIGIGIFNLLAIELTKQIFIGKKT